MTASRTRRCPARESGANRRACAKPSKNAAPAATIRRWVLAGGGAADDAAAAMLGEPDQDSTHPARPGTPNEGARAVGAPPPEKTITMRSTTSSRPPASARITTAPRPTSALPQDVVLRRKAEPGWPPCQVGEEGARADPAHVEQERATNAPRARQHRKTSGRLGSSNSVHRSRAHAVGIPAPRGHAWRIVSSPGLLRGPPAIMASRLSRWVAAPRRRATAAPVVVAGSAVGGGSAVVAGGFAGPIAAGGSSGNPIGATANGPGAAAGIGDRLLDRTAYCGC